MYVGYYVWGKMGYAMYPENAKNFERFADRHDLREKVLFDVVMHRDEHKVWLDNGGTWMGYFDLQHEETHNFIWLNQYLKYKKREAFKA
jgi:hypothetical protein